MAAVGAVAALAPQQSATLQAVLAAPLQVLAGVATLTDMAAAQEYQRAVKFRRVDTTDGSAAATCIDSAAADVYCLEVAAGCSDGIKATISTHTEVALQGAVTQFRQEAQQAIQQTIQQAIQQQTAALQQQTAALQQQITQQTAALQQQSTQQNAALQQQNAALQQQIAQVLANQGQVLEQVNANQYNQRQNSRNVRRQTGAPLHSLCKSSSGHPVPTQPPQDAALAQLAGAAQPMAVPVGTRLPAVGFFPAPDGITSVRIMGLEHANVNDLEWFYNEHFASGAGIAERRHAFLAFLLGDD
eukprot:CAMPEP_0206230136 /NCGR_PEP_ID=MMETSP0047_2-20121206/10080_1 /ASSEMBLY_ACC=CAM_ASM_000192 /TAXON_ID=195065 /ORGANISM="Chroomonas mesostigmatica_cf, Strain CCMP1168" /LENGTH=300 /DNA_ID=CAMNT_0053653503 /DNA_START=158 /DNA_END=1060 /DNA_ORIENTATION=-